MARKRNKMHIETAGSGSERWLLTYADMITLLLALFIVLFAMSTIDAQKFEAIRHSLSESFRGRVLDNPGHTLTGSKSVLSSSPQADPQHFSLQDLIQESQESQANAMASQAKQLSQTLQASGLRVQRSEAGRDGTKQKNNDVEVAITERGVVVRLAGDTFFDSGSDQIRPGLEKSLHRLALQLRAQHRALSIEGHTDGQPIGTAAFQDNLALSTARANSVFRYLMSQGIPASRLRAVGFGEWRPLVDPPAGNPHADIARNRRVEIVILAAGAGDVQPGGQPGVSLAMGGTGASSTPAAAPAPMQVIGPIINLNGGAR